jgi:adenosylhomocysteine nucleosidase
MSTEPVEPALESQFPTGSELSPWSSVLICGFDVERIAIFAALQWECRPVLRWLRQVSRARLDGFTCWQGRAPRGDVWLVKTGVGVQRAAAAAAALGDARRFVLFVSTGCAGGLAPELRAGDLVLTTTVVDDDGHEAAAVDAESRAQARLAAHDAGLRSTEGPVLCSQTALGAAAKRAAAAGGAIAVEMEAAALAARAADAQVPFLSVRAVLDGVEDDLTAPGALVDPASGGVRPLAVAAYVATHPSAVAQLMNLQRLQRAARASLEHFFRQWLMTRRTTDGHG